MKKLIKKMFRKFGIEIKKYTPNLPNLHEQVVSLKSGKKFQGNVLLSYILEPFLLKNGTPLPNTHNNIWRSLQMAKTFLDLGYCVDAIDYRNKTFVPEKEYAFCIDVRHNLERLVPFLDKNCVKMMHIDVCHILFMNAAESIRLLALQQRKGVTLRPYNFEWPNLAIEYADYATVTGNEFTINTFKYANKPIYRTPQTACAVYPWPEHKNYEKCRRNFLWLGSAGLIRKGLDLVLDAFVSLPEYHLYVYGPIEQQKDFERAYYQELYRTANIHTLGWIDISSSNFTEIANNCVALIYPSCSEGSAGSVIACMHAGVIPIISYESGVDVSEDFGRILKDCSIETIKNSIRMVSSLPPDSVREMSRNAWVFARTNHTREKFVKEYRKIIEMIIAMQGKKQISA